jgi:hypothetical protein
VERCRVGGQQGGHARHRQPHQHLVTEDHPEGGGQAALDAALAGGGNQGEVAGAGDRQEDQERNHESAVVGHAEHGEFSRCGVGGQKTIYAIIRGACKAAISQGGEDGVFNR